MRVTSYFVILNSALTGLATGAFALPQKNATLGKQRA